jgi:PAS domain S-box-containing protein
MRMAPLSAVLFTAAGAVLLFLDVEDRHGRRPAQVLSLILALFTIAALGIERFGGFAPVAGAPYASMTWHPVLLFVLLSLGALSVRPRSGLVRIITLEATGGVVARRLLPAALLAPLLLCIVSYLGFKAQWYSAAFGLAILTTLNSAVLTTLIWRTAGALNQSDTLRKSSEEQRSLLHHALQEAHAFREKVLDSAIYAVFALDLEGRFTLANQRMVDISGYRLKELLGQPFSLLAPSIDGVKVVEEMQGALREGALAYRAEMDLTRQDGVRLTVAYGWSALVVNGNLVGFVGTADDITERKEAEVRLRAHQKQIEELNGRLRSAMAETHHRVRNNLQFISALADMQIMMDRESVPVSEVRRIGSQVQALAAVHDLLTTEAKTNAGADRLWADDVLAKLAGLLQQTVGKRAVAVRADRVSISGRQASAIVVIANELIINAIKNSDADVEVHFRADGIEAHMSVLDSGPGFPEAFDPKLNANTGLELVHQLSVWDLQGDVQFTNRPEGGACVTLRLPLASVLEGVPMTVR